MYWDRNIHKFFPLSKITIKGYKSFIDDSSVELKNLTIFSGVNSSGKSSMIQPLLILKQTLEESYDPGELLINGPHVKFTSMGQLFSKIDKYPSKYFSLEIESEGKKYLKLKYEKDEKEIKITQTDYIDSCTLFSNMTHNEFYKVNSHKSRIYNEFNICSTEGKDGEINNLKNEEMIPHISRNRCFLNIEFRGKGCTSHKGGVTDLIKNQLLGIIHVPALRGNPQRLYRKTFVGQFFPGTFEPYVSSILKKWIETNDSKIQDANRALEKLNLTNKVKTSEIDDVSLKMSVNRYPVSDINKNEDWVSIADVGFGISQTLPVIVALLQAKKGQIVYIEQPEIHLHPKAQINLSELLIDAANRGVQVIIETHSDNLLLGIQTLIAEGKISSEKVALNWFSRDESGKTIIKSSKLDSIGAYGDWPEDFSDTILVQRSRYINAVHNKKFSKEKYSE